MTTKAAFEKQNGALVPLDDDGREIMRAIADGKQVMVHVHAARNVRHHRMLFVLYKKLAEGGAWDGDVDSFLNWAKIGTGHVEPVIGPNGRTYFVPKSISFELMAQDAFARWWDRLVYLVFTRLLGGDDGSGSWMMLRDEIAALIDGDMGRRAREHDERFGKAA